MEKLTDLSEFLNSEYPEESKELAEAFDILVMSLEDVYNSVAVSMESNIASKELDRTEDLNSVLKQLDSLQKSFKNCSIMLSGTQVIQDEATEGGLSVDQEKIKLIDNAQHYFGSCTMHSLRKDFTNTKLLGFDLKGVNYKEKSMKGVLVKLCELLAKENESKLLSFIGDPAMNGSKNPYFSEDKITKDGIDKNQQVLDLPLYVWVNHSCNQIRDIIVKILIKFGISRNEFHIYLSSGRRKSRTRR